MVKKILITNDDGIYSTGIEYLAKELKQLGVIMIVAPEGDRSGSGHSFTKRHPLRVDKVRRNGDFFGYSTNGTPADSVKLGLFKTKGKVDFVVSGINPGGNLGIDVFYSGTVAGAMEGAIDGYPSAAFSLVSLDNGSSERLKYEMAAHLARDLLSEFIKNNISPGLCLNINIPNIERERIKGVAITPQARQTYADIFESREDPFGHDYFWLTGKMNSDRRTEDSDLAVIKKGYITITPLRTDLTDEGILERMKEWKIMI